MTRFLTASIFLCLAFSSAIGADGDLDLTFASIGSRTTPLTTGLDSIRDIVVQSDGRIVAGGVSNGNYVLIRYTSTGDLDTTFSGDGIATTTFVGTPITIALQGDKILIAGTSGVGAVSIGRFNSDGTLDTGWDGDGFSATNFGGTNQTAQKLLVLGDQRVVMVGSRSNSDIVLARYLSDGSPDTSFNGTGAMILNFGSAANERVFDAALYSDGRVLLAGLRNDDGISLFNNFLLARLNQDGTFDTSFSGDGWSSISVAVGNNDQADAVAIGPNGKILVGGIYSDATANQPCLLRLLSDGTLDPSFDSDGILTGITTRPTEIVVQSDNRILTSGPNVSGSGIRKYNIDGSLDSSFSLDGMISEVNGLSALEIQADGKLLVGGQTPTTPDSSFYIARYLNTVSAPSAAPAMVSGRVTDRGRGVARAIVDLVDTDGHRYSTVTNSFGYFNFGSVPAGRSYILSVSSRGLSFSPMMIGVEDNVDGLEISPQGDLRKR